MAINIPFAPHFTKAQTVAPTSTSAQIKIGLHKKTLCLTNLGSNVCYVRVSQTDPTFPGYDQRASIADYCVPAGAQVTISKWHDADTLAYIAPAGDTSLHIIAGEGA